MLSDLVAAFALLTRLPVGALAVRYDTGVALSPLERGERLGKGSTLAGNRLAGANVLNPDLSPAQGEGEEGDSGLGRSVWAYPLVGATVGAMAAAVYWTSQRLGMPASLGAICALAAEILVTGGLHEDGLADTADGFGGGNSPGRKLEIMRDSRIGTYGALALMLALAARATAIADIRQAGAVAAALVTAGALGRGSLIVVILLMKPARAEGLGAGLRTSPRVRAAFGIALSTGVALLLLRPGLACGVAMAALGVALGIGWLARRQIGGYTGDVLGATEVAVECIVLGTLSVGALGYGA